MLPYRAAFDAAHVLVITAAADQTNSLPFPLPLTRAAGVVNCSQMGTLCKLIVAHEVGELSSVPCPYVYVCASAFHGVVIIMGNMLKYDNARVNRLIKGS